MATMTKTQLVKLMAGKLELTNKQAATFLETLSDVAVAEAKKNGVFVFPGTGPPEEGAAQGSHGPQPADRRSDQNQGKDRGKVLCGEIGQRRHRPGEEVVGNRQSYP